MRIRLGCDLRFEFPKTTPMIATLNVHFSRVSELEHPDYLTTNPSVSIEGYRDSFGNWCNRLVAPGGHHFSLGTDATIRDSGMPDPVDLNALQHQVENLPAETILFLLGSRYCEIVYPTRRGGCSETPHLAGRGCRLSATSCTIT
jgi:hypothetical protein